MLDQATVRKKPVTVSDTPITRDDKVVQIVHRRNGTVYVRAVPKTRANPTPAQVSVRLAFGLLAKQTKGRSDATERAVHISEGLKGFRSRHAKAEQLPGWARDLIAKGEDPMLVKAAFEKWNGRRQP